MNLRYGCNLEVNGYFTEECYEAADKNKVYLVQDGYDTMTKLAQMAFKYLLKYSDVTCTGVLDANLCSKIGWLRQSTGMADTPPHMKMNAETWYVLFNDSNRPHFNNELSQLQAWINQTYGAMGVAVGTNGALGFDTEQGITRALQAELNLRFKTNIPLTGYFDEATYEVIKNNNIVLSTTEYDNLTKLLQAALRYKNKYAIGLNGIYDADTINHITTFRNLNGLAQTLDNSMNPETWYTIFNYGNKPVA